MMGEAWTIVLAAGAGRRLAAVTGGVPKQFWRPTSGAPSLLDQTISRMRPLSVPERTLTVVADAHRDLARSVATPSALGRVVCQPEDRGTAVGVLLPLCTVFRADAEAVVVMTPSDHGVEDTRAFHEGLSRAVAHVRARQSDIVLFGVTPTTAAADYGWITASTISATQGFRDVRTFVEKPAPGEARRLYRSGAVWNTMVVVARASGWLAAFRRHLPFHTEVLTAAAGLDSRARDAFLRVWYPQLPPADFSRDFLTAARPLSLYTWPVGIGWSDLGTPRRLEQWLGRAGAVTTVARGQWQPAAAGDAA